MNISTQEGSEYFRGLLVLIGKDRVITESEITLMKRVGKALGFDKTFTEEAINSILENSYIKSEPPIFSTEELSKRFLRDGLAIARSDNGIHKVEAEWLQVAAEVNGIDPAWFAQQKEAAIHSKKDLEAHLEADDFQISVGQGPVR